MIPAGNKLSSSPLSGQPRVATAVLRTGVLLQDPTFQLNDGVSEGAAVFTLAAVPDLVAADVELAEGVEGSDLTVADVGGPHHVDQAPGDRREDVGLHGSRKSALGSLC